MERAEEQIPAYLTDSWEDWLDHVDLYHFLTKSSETELSIEREDGANKTSVHSVALPELPSSQ